MKVVTRRLEQSIIAWDRFEHSIIYHGLVLASHECPNRKDVCVLNKQSFQFGLACSS